jgi:cellulose synthase/poly-beta-1,6-N-acetylglucosamine synthase-like glycosyltransferase
VNLAAVLFSISVFIIAYTYAGYPAVVWLIGTLRPKAVLKRPIRPRVSVIIPAYNEARVIRETVLNKLECTYPAEKREILVVSDSSDDGTDEIVKGIGHSQLRLIRQQPRQGKTAGLNRAVDVARGEIIVFSDANSLYDSQALENLVSNFADPSVGYVSGRMRYANRDGSGVADSCSSYMKYENALRSIETRCGSIVGVDGAVDAIRKELYIKMSPDMLPDFVLPLSVRQQGYRVVYEPNAIVTEEALSSSEGEFRMRVRVALRALRAMWQMRGLFNPFKYGLFSFQLFSHKLLRYSIPFVLMALAILNLLIVRQATFWLATLVLQCLFYGTAALGYVLLKRGRRLPPMVYFPFYFVLLNYASLVAWIRFFTKKKQTLWSPRTG